MYIFDSIAIDGMHGDSEREAATTCGQCYTIIFWICSMRSHLIQLCIYVAARRHGTRWDFTITARVHSQRVVRHSFLFAFHKKRQLASCVEQIILCSIQEQQTVGDDAVEEDCHHLCRKRSELILNFNFTYFRWFACDQDGWASFWRRPFDGWREIAENR